MISSIYSLFTSDVAILNVKGCLTHVGYDPVVGKYPSRDFATSSKCMVITCFSSLGKEISPIPTISYKHSRPGEESLLSYQKGSCFFKCSRVSSFSIMLTPPPCICRLR
uniref:Uncharacterized protein n=1 Tax=Lepeophtheirus salmonis TaxID=72036 RepID=A0A0K2T0T1_LEPSM